MKLKEGKKTKTNKINTKTRREAGGNSCNNRPGRESQEQGQSLVLLGGGCRGGRGRRGGARIFCCIHCDCFSLYPHVLQFASGSIGTITFREVGAHRSIHIDFDMRKQAIGIKTSALEKWATNR